MQDITKSIEEGKKSMPTKYTMTDKDYQQTSQEETINDEIDTVTPEDQQCKTPVQLMSTVSSFMINKIARMPKTTGKKKVSQKNIELQLKSNFFKASNQTRKILKKSSNHFLNGRRGFCIGKVPMCRT